MTHQELQKKREEAALAHGASVGKPLIRSMYPSESRSVVAHCHYRSFLAGSAFERSLADEEIGKLKDLLLRASKEVANNLHLYSSRQVFKEICEVLK